MKRYILFSFMMYYPEGGMNDIKCDDNGIWLSFDTIEEAKKAIDKNYDFNQIVDTKTFDIVKECN